MSEGYRVVYEDPGVEAARLEAENRALREALAIAEKAHLGDPCIFCHKPHDEVGVGDCEGHRHPEACTCERCGQAWLAANYERE